MLTQPSTLKRLMALHAGIALELLSFHFIVGSSPRFTAVLLGGVSGAHQFLGLLAVVSTEEIGTSARTRDGVQAGLAAVTGTTGGVGGFGVLDQNGAPAFWVWQME